MDPAAVGDRTRVGLHGPADDLECVDTSVAHSFTTPMRSPLVDADGEVVEDLLVGPLVGHVLQAYEDAH